jgi:Ner family transcriptional regulator
MIVPMSTKERIEPLDWHPADIVAALRKAGWSLRKLSASHGYSPGALKNALHTRWPKGQRLIAEALGLPPEQIWPSRYQSKPK